MGVFIMSQSRATGSRPGVVTYVALAVLGSVLAVWGLASGSLGFTLGPALLAVVFVVLAVRMWRKDRPRVDTHSETSGL